MIQTDQELKATQERIAYFEGLVAQFRVTTSPQEFKLMAGGFLNEIEKCMRRLWRTWGVMQPSPPRRKPPERIAPHGCSVDVQHC